MKLAKRVEDCKNCFQKLIKTEQQLRDLKNKKIELKKENFSLNRLKMITMDIKKLEKRVEMLNRGFSIYFQNGRFYDILGFYTNGKQLVKLLNLHTNTKWKFVAVETSTQEERKTLNVGAIIVSKASLKNGISCDEIEKMKKNGIIANYFATPFSIKFINENALDFFIGIQLIKSIRNGDYPYVEGYEEAIWDLVNLHYKAELTNAIVLIKDDITKNQNKIKCITSNINQDEKEINNLMKNIQQDEREIKKIEKQLKEEFEDETDETIEEKSL